MTESKRAKEFEEWFRDNELISKGFNVLELGDEGEKLIKTMMYSAYMQGQLDTYKEVNKKLDNKHD